jgi:membrane protein required for beta-lactamase induction
MLCHLFVHMLSGPYTATGSAMLAVTSCTARNANVQQQALLTIMHIKQFLLSQQELTSTH